MQPSAIQSLPCLLTVGVTEKPARNSSGLFFCYCRSDIIKQGVRSSLRTPTQQTKINAYY